ncbi:hypothetical protein CDAR_258861 [Caerostris darwini]|uniref:Uncharacterized protein n=1 Tax=Caerostris darwini TaxID=1538125 RepID=A0AAV4M976_9ARAC|nr:hypothetical protein CDAR_258861 [Caerostris darwini]
MGVILPSRPERYSQLTESTRSISCREGIEGGWHLGMGYKDRIVVMATGSIQAPFTRCPNKKVFGDRYMGVILPSRLERHSQLAEYTRSISCREGIEGSHLGMNYKDRIVAMVTGSIQANEASGIACRGIGG